MRPLAHLAAAVVLLAGCRSAPDIAPAAPPSPAGDGEFPGASAILEGFDPPQDLDEPWRGGEQVLIGIRLEAGDESESWLVRVACVSGDPVPPETVAERATGLQRMIVEGVQLGEGLVMRSPLVDVRVDVFDRQGTPLARSDGLLARDVLRRGIYEACDAKAERRAGADALFSLLSLFDAIQANTALSPLREGAAAHVLRRPSLLKMLDPSRRNVSIGTQPQLAETAAGEWPGATDGRPARVFPIQVRIGDERAAWCRAVAVPPASPLHLTGGLVAFDVTHPSRPDRRIVGRVLAAARGP